MAILAWAATTVVHLQEVSTMEKQGGRFFCEKSRYSVLVLQKQAMQVVSQCRLETGRSTWPLHLALYYVGKLP